MNLRILLPKNQLIKVMLMTTIIVSHILNGHFSQSFKKIIQIHKLTEIWGHLKSTSLFVIMINPLNDSPISQK